MKKIITALLVISLVLLVACQPTETQKTEPTPVAKEPIIQEPAPEQKTIRAEPEVVAPPAKLSVKGIKIDQVCDVILPVEEFSEICGLDAGTVVSTIKQSEKNCWISFTDQTRKRLTAGLTTVDWLNAEEADREFERGISMRRKEAETDVGTHNYKYSEIERENIVWTNSKFLSHIGASTQLCTKEQLLKLAQKVDGKLG